MTRTRTFRRVVTVAFVVAMMSLPVAALAAGNGRGGGNGGGSGGRGGGPGEETAGNNLSVPAVIVGQNPFTLTCGLPSAVPPTGDPLTGYPYDPAAYFYVQGVHTWQAQCITQTGATVTTAWGDNLGGDASLKVGSPVRVELALTDASSLPEMQGFTVVKLEPNALDRESAYGTMAAGNPTDGFAPVVDLFTPMVYAAGVTLTIDGVAQNLSAEINATGKIVYGFNWRPSAAGDYTLTFTMPAGVTISGTDIGTVSGGQSVSLVVTVAGGGGGGGGGHHGR